MGFYFQHFYREWMKDHQYHEGELIDGCRVRTGFRHPLDEYCGVGVSSDHNYECYRRRGSGSYKKKSIRRGSSEYSDQSYNDYQIDEASPDNSPRHYRPRSLTPPPDQRDYVPQPQPLSYIELNRLPVVKLQGHDIHTKCCCDKPWQKDEEATQLLCGHKLHTACACKLMETGVCPICKTAEVIDDKLREIRIDLSGFNF